MSHLGSCECRSIAPANKEKQNAEVPFFPQKFSGLLTRFMLMWLNLFCSSRRLSVQRCFAKCIRKLTESEAIFCHQNSTIKPNVLTDDSDVKTSVRLFFHSSRSTPWMLFCVMLSLFSSIKKNEFTLNTVVNVYKINHENVKIELNRRKNRSTEYRIGYNLCCKVCSCSAVFLQTWSRIGYPVDIMHQLS